MNVPVLTEPDDVPEPGGVEDEDARSWLSTPRMASHPVSASQRSKPAIRKFEERCDALMFLVINGARWQTLGRRSTPA
jgi:hypothetical protein